MQTYAKWRREFRWLFWTCCQQTVKLFSERFLQLRDTGGFYTFLLRISSKMLCKKIPLLNCSQRSPCECFCCYMRYIHAINVAKIHAQKLRTTFSTLLITRGHKRIRSVTSHQCASDDEVTGNRSRHVNASRKQFYQIECCRGFLVDSCTNKLVSDVTDDADCCAESEHREWSPFQHIDECSWFLYGHRIGLCSLCIRVASIAP